ncbi:MAG: histidine--tRNA ligase [bacterium]|jgi:histidyl-tRNA synthetase|nr:histidine--tRNA ligase [bacterium]
MPITPRLYNGTRDLLPADMLPRERVLAQFRASFQLYGFAPVETPALEYLEILTGKYGDDEQLIYRLDYRNDDPARRLALRYDLTVPLARLIALHPELPLPFKRYQLQPVWRADRPQPHQGRYREFMQCDIDTVGAQGLLADAEIVAVCADLLGRLELPGFVIRLNHRRLLSALVEVAGLERSREGIVCGAVDKLDKIGLAGVRRELEERGIPAAAAERVLALISLPAAFGATEILAAELKDHEEGRRALADLEHMHGILLDLGVAPEHLRLDLTLARGLGYYTGPIFEAVLPALPHMGSLMGGGRYDGLVGIFLGREIPAVGATLGLDRILTALAQLRPGSAAATPTQVLVARAFAETDGEALRLAAQLRRAGLPVETSLDGGKLKKQLAYADKKGIPWVLVLGPDEWAAGQVQVRDMRTGSQRPVPVADLRQDPRRHLAGDL